MGHTVSGGINAVGNMVAAIPNAMVQGVHGNWGGVGQSLSQISPLASISGTNWNNYANNGNWGPTPGSGPPHLPATPSVPSGLSTPTATPAPSQAPNPLSSGGAAASPSVMSPGTKGAISAGAIGQLPGLIKSDIGSGMTGISPSFLGNQDAWASGFTSQAPYIQQIVNHYLSQNPNALGGG